MLSECHSTNGAFEIIIGRCFSVTFEGDTTLVSVVNFIKFYTLDIGYEGNQMMFKKGWIKDKERSSKLISCFCKFLTC